MLRDGETGGTVRTHNPMHEFRKALQDTKLHDLEVKGPKFTWDNKRQGTENILERVDRYVANFEWVFIYPRRDYLAIRRLENDLEKLHWQQRSRNNWLAFRDRNTTFFHKSASERLSRNRIVKMMNTGQLYIDQQYIEKIISGYYDALFATQNPIDSVIEKAILHVDYSVTQEMNFVLPAPFTKEEVRKALCTHPKLWVRMDSMPISSKMPGTPLATTSPTKFVKYSMRGKA